MKPTLEQTFFNGNRLRKNIFPPVSEVEKDEQKLAECYRNSQAALEELKNHQPPSEAQLPENLRDIGKELIEGIGPLNLTSIVRKAGKVIAGLTDAAASRLEQGTDLGFLILRVTKYREALLKKISIEQGVSQPATYPRAILFYYVIGVEFKVCYVGDIFSSKVQIHTFPEKDTAKFTLLSARKIYEGIELFPPCNTYLVIAPKESGLQPEEILKHAAELWKGKYGEKEEQTKKQD